MRFPQSKVRKERKGFLLDDSGFFRAESRPVENNRIDEKQP
jgi:hypothetical protein